MRHLYGPPKRPSKPPSINDHTLALSITVTLICLLCIGIPLAAILPPRYVRQLPINILVPLYASPAEVSWDPLYSAIVKHTDLNFTVILSPSHGPGAPPYPAGEYIAAIRKLNVFPNVQTLGYIDTERGARKITTVLEEVTTYASWVNTTGLAIHGIFFDQTPFEDTEEVVEYMRNVTRAVKKEEGILWPRLVVCNAGTVPSSNLTGGDVDVTVVFEDTYNHMLSKENLKTRLGKLLGERSNYGVLVHGMGIDVGRGGLRKLINGVRQNLEYLYVTSLEKEVYRGFGERWEEFLELTW